MDGEPLLLVEVSEAHVRLDCQVGLPLDVKLILDNVSGLLHQRPGIFPFGNTLLEIDVRRSRVYFDGIVGHGCRRTHVRRQFFQFNYDFFRRGIGMFLRICANDGDGVPILKDLFIAKNGAVPAIALIRRECNEAGDAIFSLDIFVSDYLVHTRHLFRLGSINRENIGVGYLRLYQRKTQGIVGQLEPQVCAIVQRTGHFGVSRWAGVL